MDREQAETVALQAAAYIFSNEKALNGLMAASGASAEQLRTGLADYVFLAGLLDYLLGDERLLVAFCQDQDLEPDQPARAQAALMPGERTAD